MPRNPACDPSAAVEWLRTVLGEAHPWTLGALHPSGRPPLTLTTADRQEALDFIEHHCDTHGIYYNANPARPSIGKYKKLGKDDVAVGLYVPADFDRTEDGQRLVLVPGAKEAVVAKLMGGEIGPGRPTVITDSGNGIQALWKLADPADATNERARDMVEGYGRWIAQQHGGDKCWTVNNLYRLPHTMNYPNAKKLDEGLTAVPTAPIFFDPEVTYEQYVFDWDGVFPSDHAVSLGSAETFENVADLISRYALPQRLVDDIVIGALPGSDRSAHEWRVVKELLKHGLPPEAVMGVIVHPEWGIGEKAREQDAAHVRSLGEYAEYTVERAVKSVGADHIANVAEFDSWDEVDTEEAGETFRSETKPPSGIKYVLRDPSDSIKVAKPRWLVKNVVMERRVGVIHGGPKAGKTFLCLDLACCVAMGIEFYGNRVNQGRVLYIAAEGDEYYIAERIFAWCEQHGVEMDDLTGRLKIVYSSVRLNDKTELVRFINDVRLQFRGSWDLVFVDTLTKNMVGDQSKQDVMADFFAHVDAMRRHFKSAIVIVHHTDKTGSHYRGSSVIEGDVDFMIRLEKIGDSTADKELAKKYVEPVSDLRRLVLERARESEDGGDLILHFDRYLIGLDEDGDERVTRFFTLPTRKPAQEEKEHQNATSTASPDSTESEEKRDEDGQFSRGVSDEELLGMIFLKSPNSAKDLADESRPGMAHRTIKRRLGELRKAGFLRPDARKPELTPAGMKLIGDAGIGTAVWEKVSEE